MSARATDVPAAVVPAAAEQRSVVVVHPGLRRASPQAAVRGPLIRGVSLSSSVVSSPGSVSGTVYTDANVTSVVASSSGVTMALAKVSPGVFTLSYAIPPNVPFIFKRTYGIAITATAADGRTANSSTAITLR